MTLIQSGDKFWAEISDLTIYDAAFWMQTESDPRLHLLRCESDSEYENHYFEHPGGEQAVFEKCNILLSAVRAQIIKVTSDSPNLNLSNSKNIRINISDWIEWCSVNGYSNLIKFFSNNKKYISIEQANSSAKNDNSSVILQSTNLINQNAKSFVMSNKMGRNLLDPTIDKAIKLAGNTKLADVFLQLRELAKDEVPPFTGITLNGALLYTNAHDKKVPLTKDALGKRLRNRNKIKSSI